MDIQSLLNKESDTDSEERMLALISRENAIRSPTGTLPPICDQPASATVAAQTIPSIPSILSLSQLQPEPSHLHSFNSPPAQMHRHGLNHTTPQTSLASASQAPFPAIQAPAQPQPQPQPQPHPSKVISSAIEKSPVSPRQAPVQRPFQTVHPLESPNISQIRAARHRSTSYPLRHQPSNPIVASDSFMQAIVQQPHMQRHQLHHHQYHQQPPPPQQQQQQQQHQLRNSHLVNPPHPQHVSHNTHMRDLSATHPRAGVPNAPAPAYLEGGRIYVTDANYDAGADDRRKSWKWVQHSDRLSKTKRLPNAYMVFCNKWREFVRTNYPDLDHRQVTSKLGEMWRILEEHEKQEYHDQAKILQQNMADYPADPSRSPSSSDEMEDSMPTNPARLDSNPRTAVDSYHV